MVQNQSSTVVAIILLVLIANVIGHFWTRLLDQYTGRLSFEQTLLIATISTTFFILLLVFLTRVQVISEEIEEGILIGV